MISYSEILKSVGQKYLLRREQTSQSEKVKIQYNCERNSGKLQYICEVNVLNHNIEVILTSDDNGLTITSSECDCELGKNGKCKHCALVLLHIHQNGMNHNILIPNFVLTQL